MLPNPRDTKLNFDSDSKATDLLAETLEVSEVEADQVLALYMNAAKIDVGDLDANVMNYPT